MKNPNTQSSQQKTGKNNYLIPLILVTSLFFLWGIANNLNDILIKQFKKAFALNDLQSGLVQSAFYMGYFLIAIPASLIIRKFSYKAGMIIGLILYAIGAFLFYPAAQSYSYGFFLFALFVIACGLAFLETTGNPYVSALGPAESATFRLNLSQSFNPIGCITGILIGQNFIFSGIEYTPQQLASMPATKLQAYHLSEAHSVELPYIIIGVVILLWALLLSLTKFPQIKEENSHIKTSIRKELKKLSGLSHYRWSVIAQFFYMGAQVCIWSYMIRYVQGTIPGTPEKMAANYLTASLVVFAIGRFAGTALLKLVKGNILLGIYASINFFLILIAIILPGHIGLISLVAASFFLSIMYPTIFTLGIRELGQSTKIASSILVMAIIGGALMPLLMGRISDMKGISDSLIVPAICFIIIAYFGFVKSKIRNA